MGVSFIVLGPVISPVVGMSLFFVLVTVGQFLSSLFLDYWGAFFQPIRQPGALRCLGLLLAFAGAFLVCADAGVCTGTWHRDMAQGRRAEGALGGDPLKHWSWAWHTGPLQKVGRWVLGLKWRAPFLSAAAADAEAPQKRWFCVIQFCSRFLWQRVQGHDFRNSLGATSGRLALYRGGAYP